MARKHKKGQGGGGGGGPPRDQKPQGGGGGAGGGGGFGPLRDAIRRDVEQAVTALAFAERFHVRLETQRRLFHDFPRSLEQLRSGAIERLTTSLSRLYEGGQGFDLHRFLRDLPLATAQLAALERKSAPPPAASKPPVEDASPDAPAAAAGDEAQPEASAATAPPATNGSGAPQATAADAPAAKPAEPEAPSPRLELRSKLLAAAPNLMKAAQSYRRNVATLRRAALPRRSQGPWRTDREVLEEARRAVEFVSKLYDTYAEAWADQPLPKNLYDEAAAETDRFLAWTQLDRYAELALLASTGQPRAPKPGQHVISPEPKAAAQPESPAGQPEAAAGQPEAQPATQASAGAGGETEPGEDRVAEAAPTEAPEPPQP